MGPARSLLPILISLICCLALPAVAHAQTDQSVYTDALVNGWQNWSWATVNLSNTAPVQSGSDSISVSAGPYQALYLHQTPFDSSLYTNLVFWIDGGSSGGQLLQVQATLNGTAQTVVTLPALAANTWKQITIPLSSLGVQNQAEPGRILDPGSQRHDAAGIFRGHNLVHSASRRRAW